jgi:hypothetical protein
MPDAFLASLHGISYTYVHESRCISEVESTSWHLMNDPDLLYVSVAGVSPQLQHMPERPYLDG